MKKLIGVTITYDHDGNGFNLETSPYPQFIKSIDPLLFYQRKDFKYNPAYV